MTDLQQVALQIYLHRRNEEDKRRLGEQMMCSWQNILIAESFEEADKFLSAETLYLEEKNNGSI